MSIKTFFQHLDEKALYLGTFQVLAGWIFIQAFTNCMHSYDCAHNVHASSILHTLKIVYSIDSSV